MRSPLAACPSCARHLRVDEPRCPFCRVEMPPWFRDQTATPSPATRLSRAALYALRVGALSMTTAACGGSVTTQGGEGDSGGTDASSTIGVPHYGGSPPVDAATADATGQEDSPSVVAAYGAVMVDASAVAVPYGLPPPPPDSGSKEDAAPADAKPDVPFIAPPYGLPPGP